MKRVLFLIPKFQGKYARYNSRLNVKIANRKAILFDLCRSVGIDEADHQKIFKLLFPHMVEEEQQLFIHRYLFNLSTGLAFMIIAVAAPVFFLVKYHTLMDSFRLSFSFFLIQVGVVVAILAFLRFLFNIIIARNIKTHHEVIWNFVIVTSSLILWLQTQRPVSFWGVCTQAILYTLSIAPIPVFLTRLILLPIAMAVIRKRQHLQSEARVTYQIFKTIETFRSTNYEWKQKLNKIVQHMEEIAVSIARYVQEIHVDNDPGTRLIVNERFAEITNTFRIYKVDICLPDVQSVQIVLEQLKKSFKHVIYGEWKALPATPQDKKVLSKNQLRNSLTTILLATFPVTVLLLNDYYHWQAFESETLKTIRVSCWIWFVVNLASLIDPRFNEKVNLLKDATGLGIIKKN